PPHRPSLPTRRSSDLDTIITASVGMNVKKCGRTTIETTGKVTGVNVIVFVGYSGGKSALFTRQTQFSDIAEPGDSGSLIVTNDRSEEHTSELQSLAYL